MLGLGSSAPPLTRGHHRHDSKYYSPEPSCVPTFPLKQDLLIDCASTHSPFVTDSIVKPDIFTKTSLKTLKSSFSLRWSTLVVGV